MRAIDLVYLWCDGEDANFIRKKKERFAEFGHFFSEENHGEKRYVQHDELKYALRSAWNNLPWINHIFIVTDNQKPGWLRSHPKVSIVDHSEIIPGNLLPTFASTTIEMHLHKIPGLSEHFIYSNDDMFFSRPLLPEDFFSKNGKPIVWLYPAKRLSYSDATYIAKDVSRDDWTKTLVNAWLMYVNRRGKIPFFTPAHSVDAYSKSILKSILVDYPEILLANSLPFRTGERISRLIFSYEMIYTYGCKLVLRKKTNFWARLLSRICKPEEYVAVSRESVDKLCRDISLFRPKTFCFNNISSKDDKKAKMFLNSMWPTPAPWEK